MRKTRDAYEIAYHRFVRGRPKLEAMLREERQRLKLAACLREIRERSGVTQTELARRIGTTPSVISRLEDPDYEGHSLRTLQRIVSALGMGLQLVISKGSGGKRKTRAVVLAPVPRPRRLAAV